MSPAIQAAVNAAARVLRGDEPAVAKAAVGGGIILAADLGFRLTQGEQGLISGAVVLLTGWCIRESVTPNRSVDTSEGTAKRKR